jgi:TPR repeat protein
MPIPVKILARRAAVVCLLAALPFAVITTAVAADYDKPVFEFQGKLANQGSARAQYFLAQMYEEGRGTEANAEMARHWYEQAKLNGYIPGKQVATAK